jgi:outer membrane murein-binding lipoprotein Lpp
MSDTFNDTYIDFDAEEQRLQKKIDELQAEADELEAQIQRIEDKGNDVPDPKKQAYAGKMSTGAQLSNHRKAVVWARDVAPESDDFPAWDEAVDGITLGAPRGRTLRKLQSDLQGQDAEGMEQVLFIADAVVDAPFADEDMGEGELASVLGDMHPWFLDWCEDRVDELMDPEGNVPSSGNSPGAPSTKTDSTEA